MKHPASLGLRTWMVAACILSLVCPPAQAWNDEGHMLVAMIAYAQLTPAERNKVLAILEEHPHYGDYLTQGKPAGIGPQEWAFMRAATWPDYVRPPRGFPVGEIDTHPVHKFHRGPWHFINYPYKAHQQNPAPGAPLPAGTDILKQLARTMRVLKGELASDPDALASVTARQNKAVRLCWLFHLIGDEHQPLHVTALVDPARFPGGDQGGNLLAVRRSKGEFPTKLHAYWDNLLGRDVKPAELRSLYLSLADDPQLQPGALPELASHTTFDAWAAESYDLAAKQAYQGGDLTIVEWREIDEQDAAWRNSVPTFTREQRNAAIQTARRRVVVAGHRLAAKLKEVVQ